ncbi:MAG: hypothetical protein ACREML_13190, partial [Vulcanimicrobiaceae bacterium]
PRDNLGSDELDRALGTFPQHLRDKVRFVDLPMHTDSATSVRDRLEAGETVRYLVPESVWRYIIEHGIYMNGAVPK